MYQWPRSHQHFRGILNPAKFVRENMPQWEKEKEEQDQKYAELREQNLKQRRGATRTRWDNVQVKLGQWSVMIETAARGGKSSIGSQWWHEEPDPLFVEMLEEAGYDVKVESRPILEGMIPKTQWKVTVSW
jgi:hypothetical protein